MIFSVISCAHSGLVSGFFSVVTAPESTGEAVTGGVWVEDKGVVILSPQETRRTVRIKALSTAAKEECFSIGIPFGKVSLPCMTFSYKAVTGYDRVKDDCFKKARYSPRKRCWGSRFRSRNAIRV